GGAVGLQDALHDREAEADAAEAARGGAVDLMEPVEDLADLVGRMPTPVSATRISADGRAAPGRRAALTAMLPPSGVNLIALMMRFSSTAETFSRSAMMAGSSGSSSARSE